jgi:hypothetical protein
VNDLSGSYSNKFFLVLVEADTIRLNFLPKDRLGEMGAEFAQSAALTGEEANTEPSPLKKEAARTLSGRSVV